MLCSRCLDSVQPAFPGHREGTVYGAITPAPLRLRRAPPGNNENEGRKDRETRAHASAVRHSVEFTGDSPEFSRRRSESGEMERRQAGAASGSPCPEATNVVQARSTAVAVPPGKRNGREHQDLRRRHLLVREIGNDPCTPNLAVRRPLEDHSACRDRFHQSFREDFARGQTAVPGGAVFRRYERGRSEAASRSRARLLGLARPGEKLAIRARTHVEPPRGHRRTRVAPTARARSPVDLRAGVPASLRSRATRLCDWLDS